MKTINNDIQDPYCSSEVHKLLKEKGFERKKETQLKGKYSWIEQFNRWYNPLTGFTQYEDVTPTHLVAIEWIKVNFGIWISCKPNCYGNEWYPEFGVCNREVWEDSDKRYNTVTAHQKISQQFNTIGFTSSHKATEAALLYTLQNLIQ